MSVFQGSIAEYPGVIVDRFNSINCTRGRAFFLSHCHKDHMTGLNSPQIVNALQSKNAGLYCSEVTSSLLLADPGFTQLAPYLRPLPTDEPVPMTLGHCRDYPVLSFTVTLLPAGHCPGSTMFFYQGSSGCVLYTGDFRLTLEETKRLKFIHSGGSLLKIKSLYLDTTFCHPIATTIPSREISRGHILKIAEKWLSVDQNNVLHLQLGMFGYEHIYMALAKKFSSKIHIAHWRMNAYRDLPAVVDCLTTNGESTRIHACSFRKGVRRSLGVPCGCRYSNGKPSPVLIIKPSTLWFLSNSASLTEPYKFFPECNVYRVLHSMHASYTELCEFVRYLRPERIIPCVVPLGDSCLRDVNDRLKALLPQVDVVTEAPPPLQHVTTPTSAAKLRPQRDNIDECSNDTIDDFASSEERDADSPFSLFSSPVRSFNLPSMLRLSPVGVRSVPSDSLSSSFGSGTLGSFEQTPIDLSPQYHSPSDTDTSLLEDKLGGSKLGGSKLGGSKKDVASSCNVSRLSTPDDTIKHIELSSLEQKYSPDSSHSVNEWHLTLECSSDATTADSDNTGVVTPNTKRLDRTDSNNTGVVTPNAKRLKLSRTDSDDTGVVTPNAKRLKLSRTDSDVIILDTEQLYRAHTSTNIECEVIDFIDLTQDSLSTCLSAATSVETSPHNNSLHSSFDSNRQSRSLSPFCLPPTPGREGVDSILERSTFLFFNPL